MHEQSETVQDEKTGRWKNVYGKNTPKAGQALPVEHAFEALDYASVDEAEAAARLRSRYSKEGKPKDFVERPTPRDWRTRTLVEDYVETSQAQQSRDIARRFDELGSNMDKRTLEQGKKSAEKPAQEPKSMVSMNPIEYGKQAVGGAIDAALEALEFIHEAGNWLRDNTPLKGGPLVSFGAKPQRKLSDLVTGKGEGEKPNHVRPGLVNFGAIENPVGEANSVASGFARSMSQFLTGMYTGGRVLKGINVLQGAGRWTTFARRVVEGAASDAIAFDPHDPTVARVIEDLVPDLKVPLVQYLANHDDDSRAEARLKRAVEGLGFGAVTDAAVEAFMMVAKGLRNGKRARELGVPMEPPQAAKAAEGTNVLRPDQSTPKPAGAPTPLEDAVDGSGPRQHSPVTGKAPAPAGAPRSLEDAVDPAGKGEVDEYLLARQESERALENFTGAPADAFSSPETLRSAADVAASRVSTRLPTARELAEGRVRSLATPGEQVGAARESLERELTHGFGKTVDRHELAAGIVHEEQIVKGRLVDSLGRVLPSMAKVTTTFGPNAGKIISGLVAAIFASEALSPEEADAGVLAQFLEYTAKGGFKFITPELTQELIQQAPVKELRQVLRDATFQGAAHVWHGAKDFDSWKKAMASDYGEAILPFLEDRQIYKKARDYYAKELRTVRSNTGARMTTPEEDLRRRTEYRQGANYTDFYSTRGGRGNAEVFDGIWGKGEGERMAYLNAVTSSLKDPESNMRIARKLWADHLDGVAESNLARYGDKTQGAGYGIIPDADAVRNVLRGEYDKLGPKHGNYGPNLRGDLDRYTVDSVDLIDQGYWHWKKDPKTGAMKKEPVNPGVADRRKFIEAKQRILARQEGQSVAEMQQDRWLARKARGERGGSTDAPWVIAERQIAGDILKGDAPRELVEAVKRGDMVELGDYGRHGAYTLRTLEEASALKTPRARMDYIAERLPVLADAMVRKNPERAAKMGLKAAGTPFTDDVVKAANATSRSRGAVGANALVPRYVGENIPKGTKMLDYGAGRDAAHTKALREQGHDVTAYDFGENVVEGLHDPNALAQKYGAVFASNVLNTLSDPKALRATLKQIADAVAEDGVAIFNFPKSPRKLADMTAEKIMQEASQFFGDVRRVAGKRDEPVLRASLKPPKALGAITATTALGSILGDFGADGTDEEKDMVMTAGLGGLPSGLGKFFKKYMREALERAADAADGGVKGASEAGTKIRDYLPKAGVPEFTQRPRTPRPNMDYIEADPDVKRLWKNMYKQLDSQIEERARIVTPVDETDALAWAEIQSGRMSYERILELKEGDILNAHQGRAARILEASLYKHGDDLAKRVMAGAELPPGELRRWFALQSEVSKNVYAATKGEVGRALRELQESVRPYDISVSFDKVRSFADELDPRMGDRELAEAMTQFVKEPEQMMHWARAAWHSKGDLLVELMYGAMLSGKALTKNLLGNGIYAGISIVDRAVEANVVNRVYAALGKDTRNFAKPGEATQMAVAYWETLIEQARLWKDLGDAAVRRDVGGFDEAFKRIDGSRYVVGKGGLTSKFDGPKRRAAWTSERLNLDPNSTFGSVVDIFGKVVRTGPTALNLQDASFQAINGRMALRASALRQAAQDGFQGPAMFKRMEELMEAPTERMLREVRKYQGENTFTKDFENRWWALAGQLQSNAAVQVGVMPFFKTLVRLAEAGATHTPGLNLLTSQYWNMLKRGGREAAEAHAKLITGSGFIGIGYWLASQGLIVGSAPRDKALRESYESAGWQPFSFFNPQTRQYYSFAGMEPFTTFFALSADLHRYVSSSGEPLNAGRLFWTTVIAMNEDFMAKPFAIGLSHALEVVKSPTPEKAMDFLGEKLRQFYPAAAREVTRAVDGTRYDKPRVERGEERGELITELKMLYRNALRDVPGFGGMPERNPVTGKVEALPGSLPWFPSTWTKLNENMVEVARLAKYKSFPTIPDVIDGRDPSRFEADDSKPSELNGVRLNDAEKDRWQVLMTTMRVGGKTLDQRLTELRTSEKYQRMTDHRKAVQTWQLGNAYKEAARAKLLDENPELRREITDTSRSRAGLMKLRPGGGLNLPGVNR